MLQKLILRLLAKQRRRIYIVSGSQFIKEKKLRYSTDPAEYGYDSNGIPSVSSIELPSSFDEGFKLAIRTTLPTVMKAFISPTEAISFAHCCNLDSVTLRVYERRDEVWRLCDDQSELDVNW